jgi:hypothetical protein
VTCADAVGRPGIVERLALTEIARPALALAPGADCLHAVDATLPMLGYFAQLASATGNAMSVSRSVGTFSFEYISRPPKTCSGGLPNLHARCQPEGTEQQRLTSLGHASEGSQSARLALK